MDARQHDGPASEGYPRGNYSVGLPARKKRPPTPFFSKRKPLPSFALLASFAVQVFAPQSANGKATATAGSRKDAKHDLLLKKRVLAFLCVFA
jgi:hypothetical protein